MTIDSLFIADKVYITLSIVCISLIITDNVLELIKIYLKKMLEWDGFSRRLSIALCCIASLGYCGHLSLYRFNLAESVLISSISSILIGLIGYKFIIKPIKDLKLGDKIGDNEK